MADADVPANPNSAVDDAEAPLASPSARWLDTLLWDEPPETEHLKNYRARAQGTVPAALLQEFSSVQTVDVLGLTDGAELVNGTEIEPGTWRLSDNAEGQFAVIPGDASPTDGPINLTIKVSGCETEGGEVVSLLGSIALSLPERRQGPLFANLPDMRRARERNERERQAAEDAAKEAAAKQAEEKEKQEKEAREKAAAEAAATQEPPAPVDTRPSDQTAQRRPRRRAAVTLKPTAPAPKPQQNTATRRKPARRAAVTLQPVEQSKPANAKDTTEHPKPAATKKPARRAAVTLKPTASQAEAPKVAPKAAPKAVPKSTGTTTRPARRAAVTLKPVATDPPAPGKTPAPQPEPQPEPPADRKTAAKSAVTWSKPVTRTVKSAVPPASEKQGVIDTPETGAPPVSANDTISIELGGAPEVGDPHFRVLVDGRQVLDGNIDWGIGMPMSDPDDGELCWQTRNIAWDFSSTGSDAPNSPGAPDTIVLRFDNSAAGAPAAGTLLARSVTVDGLRIDADGPYASYPDGRCAWAGRAVRQSWHGDLVFNVAGARKGDPDFTPVATPPPDDDTSTPTATIDKPKATLSSAADTEEAAEALEPIERDNATASDDFDIAFSDAEEIMAMAAEAARRVIDGHEDDIGVDAGITAIDLPDEAEPPNAGLQFREVFLAERLARANAKCAEPDQQHDSIAATTAISAEEGQRIRESFLVAWAIRADALVGETSSTLVSEPDTATEGAPGTAIAREFLTTRLKSALDLLNNGLSKPAGRGAHAEPTDIRTEAAAISAAFLEETMQRARHPLHVANAPTPA